MIKLLDDKRTYEVNAKDFHSQCLDEINHCIVNVYTSNKYNLVFIVNAETNKILNKVTFNEIENGV